MRLKFNIMKKLILILIILPILSCKAQIVAYDSDERVFVPNSGAYYKDTNNHFNPFIGEWKWENNTNNSSITLIFKKEENIDSGDGFTYDLLVGEYKYVENGLELANTLSQINNSNIIAEYHKISGMGIRTKHNRPQCSECTETERRVEVSIEHDDYEKVEGTLLLRHFVENGVEKIKVIVSDGSWLSTDPDAPDDIDIPFGTYILIKQN